jgi:hypothetical protein
LGDIVRENFPRYPNSLELAYMNARSPRCAPPAARRVRALSLLLASILGIACSAETHAVSISQDGTGQVLLMPFYTVRDGHVTSVSVVNRSGDNTSVVKLRFRESLRGASVFDLNLFLGPRDVWSGTVSSNDNGATLASTDRSCTWPLLPAAGTAFNKLHYTGQLAGTQDDLLGDSLDRTREGFVEIIEMGVVANSGSFLLSPQEATLVGNSVANAVRNPTAGGPPNCTRVQIANLFPSQGDLRAPRGELEGSAVVIDAQRGTEFVVPVTALKSFFEPVNPIDDLYSEPGSLKPDLANVSPARSDVFINPGFAEPKVYTVTDWVSAGGQAIDAVSAVLMKSQWTGEYDVSDGIQSELVMTFPTLSYSVLPPAGAPISGYVSRSPFAARQAAPAGHASTADRDACTAMDALVSDRNSAPYPQPVIPGAPVPSYLQQASLCRAVARWVVTPFGRGHDNNSVFGSSPASLPLILGQNGALGNPPQYQSGWIAVVPTLLGADTNAAGPGLQARAGENAFHSGVLITTNVVPGGGLAQVAPVHTDGVARRYFGLPVIGFSAIRARLGGQGYGGMFPLKGRAFIN